MYRPTLLINAGLVAALFLAGCAAATPSSVVEMEGLKDAGPAVDYATTGGGSVANDGLGFAAELQPGAPELYAAPQEADLLREEAQAGADVDRLVIKNAALNLVVKDPQASIEQLSALAERLGGYVVNSRTYKQGYGPEGEAMLYGEISLRVPADRLNEALAEVRGSAVRVENESISGDDVTSSYTDLQSQLRNLEAAEAQLTEIMEEAKRTEDVLNVYNQLVGIRGQIEQIKGQLKYYEESASLSLISLTLTPDIASQPIAPQAWAPDGVAKQAIEALVNTLQSLGTAAIWFGVYTLPLLLIFGLPVLVIVIVARRMWRRSPKVVAPAPKA
ncbi:MAG: DUF4349 domain-containing protein [Anaerolineales bacterium]|nr:DUF4349 domain-containing protein [Anaerolineales bacterium]